jgi:hypothetical protein
MIGSGAARGGAMVGRRRAILFLGAVLLGPAAYLLRARLVGRGRIHRYRWRTSMRTWLPSRLMWLAPKGRRDCGSHEWYQESAEVDRCYHCVVGEHRPSQF